MCTQPGKLANGTEFACRKCQQCLDSRVDDWVGRCIAESKTAVAAHSITLTYGRDEYGNSDHLRSAWLTYSDVQAMFKHLRIDGYKFKYLVAGEYGGQNGRTHWHACIFWQTPPPPHELTVDKHNGKMFHSKYWPHGHQIWQEPSEKAFRYVCKYIQKDMQKDEQQSMLRMSKKPPIGTEYFQRLARKYVAAGLAPTTLIYRFADVLRKDGAQKKFYMHGTTARQFIAAYKLEWLKRNGGFIMCGDLHGKHHPNSTLIEEHDDAQARRWVDTEWIPGAREYGRVAPPSYEVERNGHAFIVSGSEPIVGRDSRTGYPHTLYSDLRGWRWWYRKNEATEEWAWQRGEKLEVEPPSIRMPGAANQYREQRE